MKITALFLFISLMQVSASGLAQKVTLSPGPVTLEKLFREVTKQTGYNFFYPDDKVDDKKTIYADFKAVPLEIVLQKVFNRSGFRYTIDGKNIIVTAIDVSKFPPSANSAKINITGMVVGTDGKALVGASVKVKHTSIGTLTDINGRFKLENVDPSAMVVISFIGFISQELSASENFGRIVLQPATSGLEEIQIIGYGTTTQKTSTGSVKVLKSDEIGRQPVNNPLLAMQGNVAGMYVTQSNGLPGGGISISIRGRNSLGAGNEPLYIIDGMPFNSRPIEQQSGSFYALGANGDTSPFTSINPSDIESISILKDADATAIYGSRGANGVVLITTKKGRAGKTDVNINVYSGIGNPAGKMELLTTEQYLDLRRQAFANDGTTPNAFNAPDLLSWGNQNKDFQKLLITNTGQVTEATASVSGGQKNTTFFLSGTYRNEGSVFPGNKGYERGSGLLNASHGSEDKKFNAVTSISLSKDRNTLAPQDITALALTLPPNYPLYNNDGTLFWDNNFINPLAIIDNPYETKANNLRATLSLGYEFIPGLTLKTDFAYNRQQSDQRVAYLQRNAGPSGRATESTLSSNVVEGFSFEPQINYNKNFGADRLQMVVGGSYQRSSSETPYFVGLDGFGLEKLIYNMRSAENINLLNNSLSEYKYVSLFGRANYQIAGKYILNISGRRDGSSRFGPGKKFGNFGAAGAAWVFSEEDFMKGFSSWLSFGKLRGSYGSVGNDQIADYGYLNTYKPNNFKYGKAVAFYPVRYPNEDYSWEATRKIELALELGFFDNRMLLTAAGFRNRTSSMLVDNPLSFQTGFSSFQGNLPAVVQNTGFELELNTTNIDQKDFNWKTSFNLTVPRNKLVSFPDIESSTYASEFIIGQPLSLINAYRVEKIENGLVQIKDINGDGVISPGISENGRGDFVNAGYSAPKMYGGLTNTLRYKNLQLDVFLQFAKQTGFTYLYGSENSPGSLFNHHADILNLGLKPTADFGEAFDSFTYFTQSERAIGDASYIRAKNISVSYRLPASWTERVKIRNCNLYVRGQNLFTITNYLGLDPETQGLSVPPLKMFIVGIQLSL